MNIEIKKNNKIYHYSIPDNVNYDYMKVLNILADLDITYTKLSSFFYGRIFSEKKILIKLKKLLGKNKVKYDFLIKI